MTLADCRAVIYDKTQSANVRGKAERYQAPVFPGYSFSILN
jgi:hypothetical protein